MNIELITTLLQGRRQIAQWQVTERRTRRHELYQTFLKTESERSVASTRWTIWLALPSADGRQGEGSCTITPADGSSDIRAKLDAALEAAAAAPNPAWLLPAPGDENVCGRRRPEVHVCGSDSGIAAAARMVSAEDGLADQAVISRPQQRLAALAGDFAAAVQAAPWTRPSAIELFATIDERRLVNHLGLDLSERRTRLYAEFVLLHRPEGGQEVEFYDQVEASGADDLHLATRVAEAAACLRDGARAAAPPAGRMPVLIPDQYLAGMFGWYAAHADAALHVRKIAALNEGQLVVSGRGGEALRIASDARVPSLAAYRFDEHGYAACRQELVQDGVLFGLHGSGRWMQQLGRTPRGQMGTLVVPAGSLPLADLRRGALEVIRFSEFRPRHDTGAFSGEIRFAWLHRPDGSTMAVKGGSVSGVLREAFSDVRLSAEITTTGGYCGPRVARIDAIVAA